MPARLIVHAIEAADLTQGPGLTPPVAAAVGTVADAILADLGPYLQGPSAPGPLTWAGCAEGKTR